MCAAVRGYTLIHSLGDKGLKIPQSEGTVAWEPESLPTPSISNRSNCLSPRLHVHVYIMVNILF